MSMFEQAEVRAAARGNRAAQERLVRTLLPRVRNLVRYLVRGDDLVDDLAQNGLIDILQGLGTYRFDAPFERWADRVVARATFRHLKRHRLRATEPLDSEPSVPPHFEERLAARRALVKLLDQIPEAQRVALALHHGAGFSIPELAELLEIPAETVRSRIRVGMAKLRDHQQKERAS